MRSLGTGECHEGFSHLVAAVLAGGPFTVRRALKLAELIIGRPENDGADGARELEGDGPSEGALPA